MGKHHINLEITWRILRKASGLTQQELSKQQKYLEKALMQSRMEFMFLRLF